MKILFDQGVPVPLRRHLARHDVETAFERGWNVLKNGDLLKAAESAGFECFVTTDQNLRYQQNLASRRIAIIVLPTTSWPKIQLHLEDVSKAVGEVVACAYFEITF